jgi:hypothetical protein
MSMHMCVTKTEISQKIPMCGAVWCFLSIPLNFLKIVLISGCGGSHM